MEWTLRLVGTGIGGQSRSFDVMAISRPDGLGDIADLGITLSEAKQLLVQVQQQVVADQASPHAPFRPNCRSCGGTCQVKDWQPHRIATVFGAVRLKLPRFLCAGCGCGETGGSWPSHCRSTPELNHLQARLSALMPYRVAADVLQHLLPIDAGTSPETLRGHTLQVGKQLADAAADPPPAAAAITVTLDSTFIRSREDGERHLEVRVGNVETEAGSRQVFAAVAKAETDITALIQRTLETVGRTDTTEVTAFTDGCPGLRAVLANAGVPKPPILDWFHIAMRLQHAELAAANLSTDNPDRVTAKATIIAEVERLHWRIWNGKAKNAQRSIKRMMRWVMHVFKGEQSQGAKGVASRKLWHALHAVDQYLRGQAAWLVNYAKRYRAGLRVGTSITEGTANFLVNRRMNKSQQMRWSRHGADLLLQVRCAVYNTTLGAGLGHRFDRIANADLAFAKAA